MPFADLPTVGLHYELEGPAGAPVLLLSNSLGTDLGVWDAQAAALSRQLRVLRYDTRGHGASGTPPGPWSIPDLGRDVLDLLDALGLDSVAFCGLSLGGMTGQWLASHASERIERLVLVCTSAYLPPPARWHERAAAVRAGGTVAVADAVLARWFTPGFPAEHPREVARARAMLATTTAEGYARCCEAIAGLDLRADLASLRAPTLVIGGEQDPVTPVEHARLLADRVPGAQLALLPDAAHLAAVERPDAVTGLVRGHLGLRAPGDPYDAGLAVRRAVLGEPHVDRALAAAAPLAGDFQELITRYAWGSVWARPGLDRRTRSCITVAMLVTLGKEEELALHLRAALRNGVTREELAEVLLQTAVYAGVPAANRAFAMARDVLSEPG